MAKVQKMYTTALKREVLRLAQRNGKPIAQVRRSLGISDTSIHQWCKESAEQGPEAFPGSRQQTALEEENRWSVSQAGTNAARAGYLKKQWASFRTTSSEVSVH